jgi:hypothetical protein
MNAVSTRAVIGSAVSENNTGRERLIRVRWGCSRKGWGEFSIVYSLIAVAFVVRFLLFYTLHAW